jgi:hypothetical protein
VSYLFQPPEGVPRDNADYQARTVTVRDARVMASSLSVHRNGFELWDGPTSVDVVLDESQVVERYYPEVAALALLATGGTRAHVFDHGAAANAASRPPAVRQDRTTPARQVSTT